MHTDARLLPPLARCVLLGRGGASDAKRPASGRSWLDPPARHEVLSHTGNIGCRTGEVKGDPRPLAVLDFDAKAGGLDALAAWERQYGRIPGWRVRTGSDGLHIYLAGTEGLRSRKLRVLDTGLEVELKANGSYVVFAGSTHENRRRYEPESPEGLGVLVPAPGWLLDLAHDRAIGAQPSPSGADKRVWVRGGIYDIPTRVYVEALTGCQVDRRGKALCPLHDDHEPTLYAYPDGHWFCSACQVGGRIRQLAAITLGVGHRAGADGRSNRTSGPPSTNYSPACSRRWSGEQLIRQVIAKSAVGRLWDATDRPPYKQLFNTATTAHRLWACVEVARAVDRALEKKRGELEDRACAVAVQGNRIALHLVFRELDMSCRATRRSVGQPT